MESLLTSDDPKKIQKNGSRKSVALQQSWNRHSFFLNTWNIESSMSMSLVLFPNSPSTRDVLSNGGYGKVCHWLVMWNFTTRRKNINAPILYRTVQVLDTSIHWCPRNQNFQNCRDPNLNSQNFFTNLIETDLCKTNLRPHSETSEKPTKPKKSSNNKSDPIVVKWSDSSRRERRHLLSSMLQGRLCCPLRGALASHAPRRGGAESRTHLPFFGRGGGVGLLKQGMKIESWDWNFEIYCSFCIFWFFGIILLDVISLIVGVNHHESLATDVQMLLLLQINIYPS